MSDPFVGTQRILPQELLVPSLNYMVNMLPFIDYKDSCDSKENFLKSIIVGFLYSYLKLEYRI